MIIELDDKNIFYSGRINFSNPKKPIFVYPSTYMEFSFVGKKLIVSIKNENAYWENSIGVILDGVQLKFDLKNEGKTEIEILNDDIEKEHTVMIFKRMDSCHNITIEEIEIVGSLLENKKQFNRRIEVYGDSISCGEVSEAMDFVGKDDPTHNGQFSNSYYSYSWTFARLVNAELHNISQGGIPLMRGTGWVEPPTLIGMEDIWTKQHYHPKYEKDVEWDFSKYTPHLVIVAVGQNDANPENFMRDDFNSEKSIEWRRRYKDFILKLREKYPNALILLTTTLLYHDEEWDKAIDEVAVDLKDNKVRHFLYKRNGKGSPGHLRIPEAEEMALELKEYVENLEFDIWK